MHARTPGGSHPGGSPRLPATRLHARTPCASLCVPFYEIQFVLKSHAGTSHLEHRKNTFGNLGSMSVRNPAARLTQQKPCYACILRSWRTPWTSWSACGLSSTVLATVLDAHMMADARAATALAFASSAVVFADARAATALA